MKKTIKLLAAMVMGAAVLTGCSAKVSVGSDNEGNTAGNITNLGGACQSGDTLYHQSADGFYIVAEKDGQEKALNSVESYFINAMGDYIYYCDDDFKIHRMKNDGREDSIIVDSTSYNLCVDNEAVYYINYDDNQNIYKAELDGSNPTRLCEAAAYYLNQYEDELYFTDYNNNACVYSIKKAGGDPVMMTDTSAAYLNVVDGYMYYTFQPLKQDDEGDMLVYRTSLEDGRVEKLNSSPCGDVNVYDNKLYYCNWTEGKREIDCIDLDTMQESKIIDAEAQYITVSDDALFYMSKAEDGTPQINRVDLTN